MRRTRSEFAVYPNVVFCRKGCWSAVTTIIVLSLLHVFRTVKVIELYGIVGFLFLFYKCVSLREWVPLT